MIDRTMFWYLRSLSSVNSASRYFDWVSVVTFRGEGKGLKTTPISTHLGVTLPTDSLINTSSYRTTALNWPLAAAVVASIIVNMQSTHVYYTKACCAILAHRHCSTIFIVACLRGCSRESVMQSACSLVRRWTSFAASDAHSNVLLMIIITDTARTCYVRS